MSSSRRCAVVKSQLGRHTRTHSNGQVAQIAASIAAFGFNNPILVDTTAGIIAGHGRLLAARKLQLQVVPVIVLDHLTETQKRAYILADNKLTLNAGWDEKLLGLELAVLRDENFNLDLTGFDDEELTRYLSDDALPGLTAANREHPTAKPVELIDRALLNSSKSGDIVADLFGGSGSTLIACERRGRKARLLEIEPKYADVIVRRWQQFTGKQAVLDANGSTFQQMAQERAGVAV